MEVIHTIGRRKTAVARIFLSEGKGNIVVNKKKLYRILSYSNTTIQSATTTRVDRNRIQL